MRCPTRADLPSSRKDETGWMWARETPQFSNAQPDGRSLPRITVVTPSYNQGRFIETTIRSVLLQGYPNLEYIVIDGGSNDESVEIIQRYAPWLAYWVSEKDGGQAHAINKGFARASGELYAYLNSDDFYEPGALHACALSFREGHQWVVGRVRCRQEGVGDWPFPQLPGKSFANWFLSCPIPQAGTFWAAELHHEMGRFREDLDYIIDYEFWLRLRFVKGVKPAYINRTIAVYRLHPQSKTVARSSGFTREGRSIVKAYERRLSGLQQGWLWGARRHRKARARGTKAVAFLKTGDFRSAVRILMSALAVWPLLIFDVNGFLLAFKEMTNRGEKQPAMPEVWPEWEE